MTRPLQNFPIRKTKKPVKAGNYTFILKLSNNNINLNNNYIDNFLNNYLFNNARNNAYKGIARCFFLRF